MSMGRTEEVSENLKKEKMQNYFNKSNLEGLGLVKYFLK